jgi:hypothetical protein
MEWLLGLRADDPMTKSAMTRVGLARARDRGVKLGGTPFGLQRDTATPGAFLEVAEERESTCRIVALRDSGLTWRDVASVLNEEGVKSKHGGPWYAMAALRIYNRSQRGADPPEP